MFYIKQEKMVDIEKKINKNKKIKKYFILFFCFIFVLLIPLVVFGQENQGSVKTEPVKLSGLGSAVATVVGWIASVFFAAAGWLLNLLLPVLIKVAEFNQFIKADPVRVGWTIVRDLCNMFFILVLLVIAFGTILRIESYNAKRLLAKLLIMAVLINFSKTICGLIIDFAQVIMLTFVNAFSATGANYLIDLFDVRKLGKFTSDKINIENKVTSWDLAVSLILGVIAMLITLVVVVVLLATLVIRIIMLWLYIILSPIAFLASTFPGGQKYASQWWEEFIKYVIIGPVLAFFLWLAITNTQEVAALNTNKDICVSSLDFFCTTVIQKYVIVIGFLIGGLTVAQGMGGVAGRIAGKGMTKIMAAGAIAGGLGYALGKRMSGISYVQDTAKQYLAMRKSNREIKARERATQLAGVIGSVKEKFVAKLPQLVKDKTLGRWESGIRKDKDKLNNYQHIEAIRKRKEFSDGGYNYTFDETDKTWKEQTAEGIITRQLTEHELQKDKIGVSDLEVENRERSFRRAQKAMKLGLGTAGGVLGASLFGPAGLILGSMGAVGGFAAGYKGVPKLGKTLIEAGKIDKNLASNYNKHKIEEAEKEIKYKSDKEILEDADNQTLNSFERSAAVIEALNRRLYTLEEAIKKSAQIQKEFGGINKKTGRWNDPKIEAKVEAILEKNYPGGSKVFRDLERPDQEARARKIISERFEDGTYNFKDLDIGTLERSKNEWSTSLKTSTFVKQYKDQTDAKKKALESMLKSIDTKAAKEKLAHITDINTAFVGHDDWKDDFIKTLSVKQIEEMVTDTTNPAKLNALRQSLNGDINKLAEHVRKYIEQDSPISKSLKNILEV